MILMVKFWSFLIGCQWDVAFAKCKQEVCLNRAVAVIAQHCLDLEDLVICANYSSSKPFRTTIQSAKLSPSSSQRNGLDCPFWFGKKKQPTKQTNKKNEFQVQSIVRSSVILGTASNGFWVMRSHCRDCLFDVTHKEASILSETLHSVMMRGGKNDEKSKWLPRPFEPQVKCHCESCSPE